MSKVLRLTKHPDPDVERYEFNCPGCRGSHQVWTKNPGGPEWTFNGDLEKPTFSPSILVTSSGPVIKDKRCHSFVRNGNIQFLSDCYHALAGKIVPLPSWKAEDT